MRYGTASAFRAAIDARLEQAQSSGLDRARQRRIIAFDRLLARLAAADHGGWLLKGGAALELRFSERARSTRDIDLAVFEQESPVDCLLDDIEHDPFGDFFAFDIHGVKHMAANDDRGPVKRLSVEAILDGRTFERFVVDLVAPNQVPSQTDRITLGKRFTFADLPTVELAVIDLPTHFAEKLSAYVRTYDRPNTRVKDLVDMVLLIESTLEPSADVYQAVVTTFTARSQVVPGTTIPSLAHDWEQRYAPFASDLQLATVDSYAAHHLVEQFWQRCHNT